MHDTGRATRRSAAERRLQPLPGQRPCPCCMAMAAGRGELTGVFAFDLSLAELRALRARQPAPSRDHSADGLYAVPTLHEYLSVAAVGSQPPCLLPGKPAAMAGPPKASALAPYH